MSIIVRYLAAALFLVGGLAEARQLELSILFTTDVHGHIWPTTDYEGHPDVGGFLRCAGRIETLRAERPASLLLDIGDTFQGAPESFLTGGRLLIDGLNFMGYDAWVLGNHEFDWWPEALRRLHDQADVPFLAANLYFTEEQDNWLPKIRPYIMREIDGVRIAVIGLTTQGIPRWSRPHLLDFALFKPSVETLREVLPRVREEGADIIIVAGHQGYKEKGDDFANEIHAVMRTFPEIDVFIGGHTHTPVHDMLENGVLFVQSGYHGIWLGEVTLVYDTVEKAVVKKSGRLDRMDASVPFHEGLLARWRPQLDAVKEELDQVIGHNPERLTTSPDALGRSPMQNLIAKAIAEGTGADLVLHGSLGEEALEAGPVTYRDVWKVVPYENTIGLLSLTPAEIRTILTENRTRELSDHSLGPYGFTYTIAPFVPEDRRIADLRDLDGNPLQARKRYVVALNSFVLASGGNRYPETRLLADRPESRLRMLPVDTRALVVSYIEKNWKKPSTEVEKEEAK